MAQYGQGCQDKEAVMVKAKKKKCIRCLRSTCTAFLLASQQGKFSLQVSLQVRFHADVSDVESLVGYRESAAVSPLCRCAKKQQRMVECCVYSVATESTVRYASTVSEMKEPR